MIPLFRDGKTAMKGKILKVEVNYYSVSPSRFIAGTAGSYGFEQIELSFSSEWESLDKKLVFQTPSGRSVSVLYLGEPVDIPSEVMAQRGVSKFAVVGYEGERVLISVSGELDVLGALDSEADNARTPTPSEIAQVLEVMERNTAISESVRADADNGVFNGAVGEAAGFGKPSASIQMLPEGSEPTVSVSASGEDAAKVFAFSFGIPAVKESPVKKYSVRFSGSAPAGSREDDAVGMRAEVAVDDDTVVNDFDSVSFFNRPICNCVWDASARRWRVKAYLGEPDFDWYGANGEVMYEATPFYYKADFDGAGAPTYVSVTATPIEGYSLAPVFKNGYDKMYFPCFNIALVDGLPVSRAGLVPHTASLNDFMILSASFDAKAGLETVESYFSDALLLWVEFATKSWKNMMAGVGSLPYTASTKIQEIISETSIRVNAKGFVVGQEIAVGTAEYGGGLVPSIEITALEETDAGTVITVAEPMTNISQYHYVSSRMYKTGAALTKVTKASSGSPVSNTDGKHPCVWRGKENPWCNGSSWICNMLVKRNGSGVTSDPYVYKLYYLPDISKYSEGTLTEDYIEADFELATSNGNIKTLCVDKRYPFLFGAKETVFSTAQYMTSYYYPSSYELGAVRMGGEFNNGKNGGFLMDTTKRPNTGGSGCAARLLINE